MASNGRDLWISRQVLREWLATMMGYDIPAPLIHNIADFECFDKQIALESIE